MTLSSQTTRSGLSRRYAGTSRKPRAKKWPWLVLVLGGGAVALAIGWISGAVSPEAIGVEWATDPVEQPQAKDPSVSAGPAPAAASTAAAESTTLEPAPSLPPVPTISLGTEPPIAVPTPAATGTSTSTLVPIPAPVSVAAPTTSTGDVATQMTQGMTLIEDGRLIEGRRLLSNLLFLRANELAPADAQAIRQTLTTVNQSLLFSPRIVSNDPLIETYRVQPGDALVRIVRPYHVPYPFIEQINRIDARRLRVGQQLKMVKGPFHARVVKHDYRIDLYLKTPAGEPIYACSFPVGLGEGNSTPVGNWVIEAGRKVKNPAWASPRTSEYYAANDPRNPIGEYWLAIKGVGPRTEGRRGYGIHGTIEPESVGQQMSMGCVRLRDADIQQVFHMLEGGQSTVQIVP